MAPRKNQAQPSGSASWDPVADWYAGWVGPEGSEHHRRLAIPALLDLLRPAAGEHVLDVGCGPGVLAPRIASAGTRYTGVDASRRLIAFARRHHGAQGRFVVGDATRLREVQGVEEGACDAAVFLLSIQDIDPLEGALRSAAWALRPGGRMVMLMTHPCFRIPRQSGWGWDTQRRLRYRHRLYARDVGKTIEIFVEAEAAFQSAVVDVDDFDSHVIAVQWSEAEGHLNQGLWAAQR